MRRADGFTRLLAAAAAGLALAAAGCTSRASKPLPAAGGDQTRALFERSCSACHGPRGEGKQLGTLRVPSLREGRALTDPDARILTQIRDGGNGMPPFKYSLDDEQIETLARFVRTELQGRPSPR